MDKDKGQILLYQTQTEKSLMSSDTTVLIPNRVNIYTVLA